MNLKDISTVDLVAEVLERAKNIDALQELMGGHRRIDAGPPDQPQRRNGHSGRGRTRMSAFEFIEGMRAVGRAATVNELARRITKGDTVVAQGHIARALKEGRVERLGNKKPHAYQLTGSVETKAS